LSKIKILIADDHPLLRHGIRQLLEDEPDFQVVAEAGDGEEALDLADKFQPDVVIMDIGMPKRNGLEATKRIKTKHPATAVLVLTVYDDDEYVLGLLEAGASGYLLKNAYGKDLISAIRDVSTGEMVFNPAIGQKLLKRAALANHQKITIDEFEQLTPREVDVLTCAARGMNNREIALYLDIGLSTVKGHMVGIFTKMRVDSRTKAILRALKLGIITLDEDSVDERV
jgi:two-component system, NarL family, response regulator LiaR